MSGFDNTPTPIFDLRNFRGPEQPGRSLLILDDGFVAAHPLPETGEMTIGRAPDADISVDVPWLSRRHALLRIATAIEIEDLGSANGTFVGDTRLEMGETVELHPGEIARLGSTTVVLQDGSAPVTPRRIWTIDQLQQRLDQDCHRAQQMATGLAIIHLSTSGKRAKAHALCQLLGGWLRPCDILASGSPDSYDLLLPDTRPGETNAVIRRLQEALSDDSRSLHLGIAYYPRDGQAGSALLEAARARARGGSSGETTNPRMVVESEVMRGLLVQVERIADSRLNVLLLGETGVGKEVLAKRIHSSSPRSDKPFLPLNCAGFSAPLMESQIFGHERGAFTGAHRTKLGLLEVADGGTVFLDEVGEIPLPLQAKLLRVLEERQVRRVGSVESRPVDVRIVAATNRNLEEAARTGAFRADLFHRLSGVSIVIPPLRDRREEIEPLAHSFIARASRWKPSAARTRISPAALDILRSHDWPGNVRELRNVIERAVVLSEDLILPEHLPANRMRRDPPTDSAAGSAPGPDHDHDRDEIERAKIVEALSRSGGNQTRAAALLGISRTTLIGKIAKYGLPRPRKQRGT